MKRKGIKEMTYLAFDIGGTNIKYAAITGDGVILIKGKFKSPKDSFDELIHSMGEVYRELVGEYSFVGIALSMPGAPNNETGICQGDSALPYIHGPNFKAALLKETGLSSYAENDAKSAALGEVWMGAAKDVKDALFIVIGTGVGGAIVKNKKVHHGINLLAGEFGYMILESDFKEKKFDTLSGLGSTGSLVKDAAHRKGLEIDQITGEEVFTKAANGDVDCQEAIEKFYESIAVSIFNLMYFYNPEKIIIGGAISSREDLIINIKGKLQVIKDSFDSGVDEVDPPIVPCTYEGDANLLGAVYNYMTKG
jgi:glucokinase